MKQNDSRGTQSLYSSPQNRETILQCTEQITRTIQELCKAIQEPDKEECVTSAEKVKVSVVRLASVLPKVLVNVQFFYSIVFIPSIIVIFLIRRKQKRIDSS